MTPNKPKRRIVVGEAREDLEKRILLNSGMFDAAFYCRQANLEMDQEEAIAHYLASGHPKGLSPSPHFDPSFYQAANDDIGDIDVTLFTHFVNAGVGDGRYGSRNAVRADALELRESPFGRANLRLSNILEETDPRAEQLQLDPIEAHLAYRWRSGKRIVRDFEDTTYHTLYGYNHDLGMPPIMHFIRFGSQAAFFRNQRELAVHRNAVASEFDEEYYESHGRLNKKISALNEFCSIGWRLGRNPNRRFNTNFYLDVYPDIRSGNISPFYHFVTSGRAEERAPRPALDRVIAPGSRPFDPTLQTVIVAVHEASRTGAPLLGLEIGRKLGDRFNVIFVLMKGGQIEKDFESAATYVVKQPSNVVVLRYLFEHLAKTINVRLLIANSVETVEAAEAASTTKIATVALLHEFADYTLPPGKISRIVTASDIVVTPAEVVALSAQTEIRRVGQYESNNIRVRPQGKLEQLGEPTNSVPMDVESIREIVGAKAHDVKIVLGAGHVQARKGVDIFVQTAHEVVKRYGDKVRFLWVGGGYHPQTDVATSVWIRAAVERLGLSKYVYFLPEQPDLEAFYEIADLFYLSSRLDPFPNVAIDSIVAGKRIVCFEQASGVAEWIADGRLDGATAEYLNVSQAADRISELLNADSFSEKNRTAGRSHFSMDSYLSELLKFGEEAAQIRAEIVRDAQVIRDRKLIDENFFSASTSSSTNSEDTALKYSAWSRKGLVVWNPRPGFNEGKYRVDNGLQGRSINILLHAAAKQAEPRTHECHLLSRLPQGRHSLRVAVHLHLHYSDLAPEFAERLSRVIPTADLFITVPTESAKREVSFEFREYAGNLTIEVFQNRGRDIGPMLEVLRNQHRNYDVFGHFHGKKSLFVGGDTGAAWRSFLMDTLAGSPEEVSRIIGLFESDPRLGLVFAEDRLNAGWTSNMEAAAELARNLKLEGSLDGYPIYPIGTMFWARPEALMPLISSKLSPGDFPPEPLPDDGTSLHALERLIPTIVRSQDYSWCTVRNEKVNRQF